MLQNTTPLKFSPTTASDALDSSDLPPGSMQNLRNLIPDPTTKNLWTCRPASILTVDFQASHFGSPWSSGFSSAFGPYVIDASGFISIHDVVGTRVFGMVALAAWGNDIPFCYDLATSAFIAIAGVTMANTPTSPATTGSWTPPTMDVIATKVVLTHPGFNTGNGYFGSIDISNPAALTWTSGNTATTALPAVPIAVKNFNGRAYFLVNPTTGNPGAYFSDVLVPTTITSGTQVITFDDNIPLTALGALGVSQTLGGILQALIVFKGVSQMYQITGDASSIAQPLSKNALNVATGTLAPNSIVPTPKGLSFVSPEGVRIIDFNATVSDPIGDAGTGITVPFISAVQPTRICGSFGHDTLRLSVQNGNAVGTPNQEWWFDFTRQAWSGPHDFPASSIDPYRNTFIMVPVGVFGKLFQSDASPSSTSTYVENGTQMTYTWQTSMLPDTDQMCENAMVETTLHLALSAGVPPIQVSALDQDSAVFDTVAIDPAAAGTLWGAFNWGQAVWGGGQSALAPRPVSWHQPIVFRRLSIVATGQSAGSAKVGRLHLKYEQLGYLQQ